MNTLPSAVWEFDWMAGMPLWAMILAKISLILLAAWTIEALLASVNPRWRVLLWRITAVGLIVLPIASYCLPAFRFFVEPAARPPLPSPVAVAVTQARDAKALSSPVVVGHSRIGGIEAASLNASDAGLLNEANVPLAPAAAEPPTVARTTTPFPWVPVLLAVWLGGMAVLLVRLLLGHFRIAQLGNRAELPPPRVLAECRTVAQAIGCRRRVAVLRSSEVSSPFLCGLFGPRLLLPARMCEPSYRDDLPGILAHELTHVRSHDVPWSVGLHLLSIVLWPHPLAWRTAKAHLAACELVCDAVSANFVGDVAGYCRTLARVAVEVHTALPVAGIAMARTSAIGRRLNALRARVFDLPLRRRNALAFGAVAILIAVLLGVLQIALAAPPAKPAATTPETKTDSAPKPESPSETSSKETSEPNPQSMRVRVLDPENNPAADADVHASVWTNEKGFRHNRDYKTDAKGVAVVELPTTRDIVRLWVGKKPFVTMFSHWEQNELASGTPLPSEYTVRLERGVTAGGRIVDEQGKPIVGAMVEVMKDGGKPTKGDDRTEYQTWLASKGSDMPQEGGAATTDADGRWRIERIPDNDSVTLRLKVSHPDYASDTAWGQLQDEAGITTESLRHETATLTLPKTRGVVIQGRITDHEGKPIKDAKVMQITNAVMGVVGGSVHKADSSPSSTDADGRFHMRAMESGRKLLAVLAPGWAAQLRKIDVKPDMPSQDFRMEPGKPIELRFVDAASKSIPAVSVQITRCRGELWFYMESDAVDIGISKKAGKTGVWRWDGAPDGTVELGAYLEGFAPRELEVNSGEPPLTVTLKSEHRISGSVSDATTGKPIPQFAVIPLNVFRKDWLCTERDSAVASKDGRLDYLATRTDIPLRLRVEAMGYRTQDGPEFSVGDDGSRIQNFQLQPSKPVAGKVLDVDGQPVKDVEVLVATPSEQIGLQSDFGNHRLSPDASGCFKFPDPNERFTVVATTNAGFAMADFAADQHDVGELRLRPWASIRGQFTDGGRPVKGAVVFLDLVCLNSRDRPRVDTNRLQVRTDATGRFQFPKVPPVPVSIRVGLGPWEDEGFRSGPCVPLDLQPGQQVDLDLGKGGATVRGKIKLTGKAPADLDCTYSLNYLVRREPGIAPPPEIAALGFDIRKGWQSTWRKTERGIAYLSTLQHWFVKLAADGSFQISGVPPGEYDLAVEVYAKPSGCLVDPLAKNVVTVTVTAADAARGELTIPEIPAEVIPIPAVGDTPSIHFQRADGADGSLADFRGKPTVIDFWASWCGPCRQQVPAARQLQQRLAQRGFAWLSLSVDEDAAAWQAALKREDLPGIQGRLATAKEAGMSGVPVYWLLDATGKIIAKAQTPEELAEAIGKAADPKAAEEPAKSPEESTDDNSPCRPLPTQADAPGRWMALRVHV